jgi:hypothetical protein
MKCYCCKKDFARKETLPTCVVYPNGKPARICRECEKQFERTGEEEQDDSEPCPNCDGRMDDGDCRSCDHCDSPSCMCESCFPDEDWDDEDDDNE